MTVDAIAGHDYERAHDLAWRTAQTGPRNDPAIMYLLARAQSLSGRADDARVMLGRLADMGVVTDAATNDDFARVRTLSEWPRLRTHILTVAASAPSAMPRGRAPYWAAARTDRARASASARSAAAPTAATPSTVPNSPAVTVPPAEAAPPATSLAEGPRVEDAFRLPHTPFDAAGLAYDRVSARYVLADPGEGKLVIVDERSRRVVDLVEADSAGFGEITAIEIDPRRGDLWVVSAGAAGDDAECTLHKLQLVSGRPLLALPLPKRFGSARFADVAVSPGGTVFVLDSVGGRVFRLAAGSQRFDVAARLALSAPVSLAPAGERTLYVAHRNGIVRVEVGAPTPIPLNGPAGVPLGGFERIRWDRDSLVGVQKTDGGRRVVRLRLGRTGRAVTAVAVAETNVNMPDPRAATLADHAFYYMTQERDPGGATTVVRRVPLP
jgi:hypothetical protein